MHFHLNKVVGMLAIACMVLLLTTNMSIAQQAPTFDTEQPLQDSWTLYSEDPVITRVTGNRYLNGGAIIFHEGQFHLFSNVFNSWPGATRTFYYTSPDGIEWTRAQEEPLFTIDDVPLEGTGALMLTGFVEPDGTWVLYYHTYTAQRAQGFIGRATASSPQREWIFDETPALSPGSEGEWDDLQVMRVNVIPTEDEYVMYYAGVSATGSQIGMARSEDGITFEKYDDPSTTEAPFAESDPIFTPTEEWEESWVGRPELVQTDDGWVMLYEGGARGSKTGIAVSEDGINFYRYSDNPLLTTSNMVNGYPFFQGAFFHHDDRYFYLIEAGNGRIGTDIFLYTLDGTITPMLNEIPPDESDANGIQLADRDNLGNASDLVVQFQADTIGQELRLFVTKAEQSLSASDALANSNYMSMTPTESRIYTQLPTDLLDADGDAITEGTAYQVLILNVDDETLSEPSNTVELQNVGTVYTVASNIPVAAGGLNIDNEGNLYIADFGEGQDSRGNAVYKVTPQGDYNIFFESSDLLKGTGNIFDSEGNFYQSGYRSDTVLRVTPDGDVSVLAEDLRGPVGMVIHDGVFYVNNCDGNSIQRITADGEVTQLVQSTLLSCPNGLTQDDDGNLYVANFRGSAIVKVTLDGEASVLARLPGSNNAHVLYHDGILYAVSRGENQIFTITLDGGVELFAGTGEQGNQDGALLNATFSLPNDLTLSPNGRILYLNEVVADTDGTNYPSVIRAIVLPRPE